MCILSIIIIFFTSVYQCLSFRHKLHFAKENANRSVLDVIRLNVVSFILFSSQHWIFNNKLFNKENWTDDKKNQKCVSDRRRSYAKSYWWFNAAVAARVLSRLAGGSVFSSVWFDCFERVFALVSFPFVCSSSVSFDEELVVLTLAVWLAAWIVSAGDVGDGLNDDDVVAVSSSERRTLRVVYKRHQK